MREVVAGVGLLLLMGGMTHLSAEAVVAQEERDEAVAAAMRAEAAATESSWLMIQAVERQDRVCECTYNLVEDPMANHLRHAAALDCKRCRIVSRLGPTND